MANVIFFFRAALPWIAIGLFVAVTIVMQNAKASGEPSDTYQKMKNLFWAPFLCFMAVSILEFSEGKKSSGTTWLVLGIVNFILFFKNSGKK